MRAQYRWLTQRPRRWWAYFHLRFRDRTCLGKHRNVLLVLLLLVAWWPLCWRLAKETGRALTPPPPPNHSLQHFRRNNNLQHYMENIKILIEPSQTPCDSLKDIPVVFFVASSPLRFSYRQAVRQTWAKYQPTFFVLGLHGDSVDEQLVDNYVEAKDYSDIIVFEFRDHYQNLTVKTALMMQWSLDQCPHAQFFFKTDDDMLVNPWKFHEVLKENANAQLVGYRRDAVSLHRDEYNKWFVPRWLYYEDKIDMYLSGAGYLINGDFLPSILKKAYQVPLINLEDIYFTHLVAHKGLGYTLTHDKRLSPFKPWLKITCIYWGFASIHNLEPQEMLSTWSKLENFVQDVDNTKNVCSFFESYFGKLGDLAF